MNLNLNEMKTEINKPTNERMMTNNFQDFRKQLSQILDTREGFDSEWYQDWYIDFKDSGSPDVKDFARLWFGDISFDTHYYQLKKNFKPSN